MTLIFPALEQLLIINSVAGVSRPTLDPKIRFSFPTPQTDAKLQKKAAFLNKK
jgi:hypothetical protein